MKKIKAPKAIRTPYDTVIIEWEADGSSGQTHCEAWRSQHEIDCLFRAGYKIIAIYGSNTK